MSEANQQEKLTYIIEHMDKVLPLSVYKDAISVIAGTADTQEIEAIYEKHLISAESDGKDFEFIKSYIPIALLNMLDYNASFKTESVTTVAFEDCFDNEDLQSVLKSGNLCENLDKRNIAISKLELDEYVNRKAYLTDLELLYKLSKSCIEEKEDAEDEEKDISSYDSSIIMATERVMEVYDELFSAGFGLAKPQGILTPQGLVYLNNDTLCVKSDAMLEAFYTSTTARGSYSFTGITSELKDITNGCSYLPSLLLAFAFGRRLPKDGVYTRYYEQDANGNKKHSWKVYRKYVEKKIASLMSRVASSGKVEYLLDAMITALTNCVLVVEFNPRIAFKVKVANIRGLTAGLYQDLIKGGLFQRRGTVDYLNENTKFDVTDITIVFDQEKFSKFPIFAFQALDKLMEDGVTPSWKNVLLGKAMNDQIYTHNFEDDHFTTNIIAGSGSGKGVMTLNLLAAGMGDDLPVFYLDCKPDMAKTLNDIASAGGCNSFTYDAKEPKWGSAYAGTGWQSTIPQEVLEAESGFTGYGALSYVKAMQLTLLLTRLRSDSNIANYGLDKARLGGRRCIFIFDEFLAMNGFLETFLASLEKTCSLMDSKVKKESPLYQYYMTVLGWVNKVSNELNNFYQADGRVGSVNLITLFQAVNGVSTEGFKRTMLFTNAMKNQNGMSKLLGRGVSTGYEGTLGLKGTPEFSLIEGNRYFGYTTERQCKEQSKIHVFKPYLILNSSDENHVCMRTIRQIDGIDDIIGETGQADPRVGFEGYVNAMLGGNANIAQKLQSSYDIMMYVLELIGFEGSVEDFLYDFSPESFKSIDAIMAKMAGGSDDSGESNSLFFEKDDEEEYNSHVNPTGSNFTDEDFSPNTNNKHEDDEELESDDALEDFLNSRKQKIANGTPSVDEELKKQAEDNVNKYNFDSEFGNAPEQVASDTINPIVGGSTELNEELDDGFLNLGNEDGIPSVDTDIVGSSEAHESDERVRKLEEELRRQKEESAKKDAVIAEQLAKMNLFLSYMQDKEMREGIAKAQKEAQAKQIEQERVMSEPFTKSFFGKKIKLQGYDGKLDIEDEIAITDDNATVSQALVIVTDHILKDITNMFGGLDRVSDFMVMSDALVINSVIYSPRIPENVIEKLPLDIRNDVKYGRLGWVFLFHKLRDMPNLTNLAFDSVDFVFKKVRIDLGKDKNFEPKDLFGVCPKLMYLQIENYEMTRKNMHEYDDVFHAPRRSTQIMDSIDSWGVGATKSNWQSVKDIYNNPNKRGFWKATQVTLMTGVTATTGVATLGLRAGRKLGNLGKRLFGGVKDVRRAMNENKH